MLSKSNPTILYLIGILIIFAILIFVARDSFIPSLFGDLTFDRNKTISKPKLTLDSNLDYLAIITTNQGTFTIDLYENFAPNNVNNFVYLSKSNYYDQTKIHRVIKDFLIQGGDRNTLNQNKDDDGLGSTPYTINDEVNWLSLGLTQSQIENLTNAGYSSKENIRSSRLEKYSLVMASNGPNTNSSQFFIVTAESSDTRLDEYQGRFTVIGRVSDGFDILDKINTIEVDATDPNIPRPLQEIVIQDIEIRP